MSSGNLLLEYVDVRLQKEDNVRDRTNCSSAILSIDSINDIHMFCNTYLNEEDNFRYNERNSTKFTELEVKLANLYKTNELDAPQMVWIRVSGEGTSLFLVVSVSIKRFPLRFGHVTCKKRYFSNNVLGHLNLSGGTLICLLKGSNLLQMPLKRG